MICKKCGKKFQSMLENCDCTKTRKLNKLSKIADEISVILCKHKITNIEALGVLEVVKMAMYSDGNKG